MAKSKLGKVDISGIFLAQVAPGQNEFLKDATWDKAYGNRVKLRIPGIHPAGPEVQDNDLPWAVVSNTTTTGNLNQQSSSLWGGEWVMCSYVNEQLYIIAVLGKNITEPGIKNSINGTTYFKNVNRFNGGLLPGPHQIIGAKPTGQANLSEEVFKQATKTPPNGRKFDPTTGREV